LGHVVLQNSGTFSRGEPTPSIVIFSGSFIGKSAVLDATEPHDGQLIIGIGQPQYLCLETPQSRKR